MGYQLIALTVRGAVATNITDDGMREVIDAARKSGFTKTMLVEISRQHLPQQDVCILSEEDAQALHDALVRTLKAEGRDLNDDSTQDELNAEAIRLVIPVLLAGAEDGGVTIERTPAWLAGDEGPEILPGQVED